MSACERRPTGAPSESPAKKTEATVPPTTHHGTQGALMGVDLAIANRDDFWWPAAMRAVRWLAQAPGEFDAWSVSELGVPDPDHPNRWGALFRAAAVAGIIVPAGFTQSRRPGRAGGVCRVWRGAR